MSLWGFHSCSFSPTLPFMRDLTCTSLGKAILGRFSGGVHTIGTWENIQSLVLGPILCLGLVSETHLRHLESPKL